MSTDNLFTETKRQTKWPVDATRFLDMMTLMASNAKKIGETSDKSVYLNSVIEKCIRTRITSDKYHVACYLHCKHIVFTRNIRTNTAEFDICEKRIIEFIQHISTINWNRRVSQFEKYMKSCRRMIGLCQYQKKEYDSAFESLLLAVRRHSLSSARQISRMINDGIIGKEQAGIFCDTVDGWIFAANERLRITKMKFQGEIQHLRSVIDKLPQKISIDVMQPDVDQSPNYDLPPLPDIDDGIRGQNELQSLDLEAIAELILPQDTHTDAPPAKTEDDENTLISIAEDDIPLSILRPQILMQHELHRKMELDLHKNLQQAADMIMKHRLHVVDNAQLQQPQPMPLSTFPALHIKARARINTGRSIRYTVCFTNRQNRETVSLIDKTPPPVRIRRIKVAWIRCREHISAYISSTLIPYQFIEKIGNELDANLAQILNILIANFNTTGDIRCLINLFNELFQRRLYYYMSQLYLILHFVEEPIARFIHILILEVEFEERSTSATTVFDNRSLILKFMNTSFEKICDKISPYYANRLIGLQTMAMIG